MPLTVEQLPLTETVVPETQDALVEAVCGAAEAGRPIYPLGGCTALGYGLPATQPGLGLSLAKLNRIVDYPARDMTITVEAGVTMATLAEALAAEGQRLPIDAPQAEAATLGGILATNFSGPRRFGCGTMRDYVIGITAVDGRGTPFHGGGRVVKNVAGYDFCKLLTGSLGTLGVVAQVTLKVVPRAQASAFLYHDVRDLSVAESLLAGLIGSRVTPTAVELLCGPAWTDDPALGAAPGAVAARLVVGLEGTREEVEWMTEQLAAEWLTAGIHAERVADEHVAGLWSRLTEFPAADDTTLVVKANLPPSATVDFVQRLRAVDDGCSVLCHAGNGIVVARLSEGAVADASHALITELQPAARNAEGNLVVLSYPEGLGLTRQAVWGGAVDAADVMREVKRQFDPQGLLNRGRFVYGPL